MMLKSLSAVLLLGAMAVPAYAAQQPDAPSMLFVQSAKGLTVNGGTMTLTGVSPTTIYFSDRPQRMAGHIDNAGFFKRWAKGQDNFKNDPPNATLSSFSPEGTPMTTVVTLRNPRIEGGNLSYDVEVISGKLPRQSSETALFIDDARFSGCDANYTYEGAPCWADKAFSVR
jgi:hypothetical protein